MDDVEPHLPVAATAWWTAAERLSFGPAGDPARACRDLLEGGEPPAWMVELTAAHDHELNFRTEEAAACLERASTEVPDGAWRRAWELLGLRVAARSCRDEDGFRAVLGRVRTYLDEIPEEDEAVHARALHLLGVIHLRIDEPVIAEEALSRAMPLIGETPARAWLLDSFGQALIGQGTWVEARRNLAASLAAKRAAGDHLGVAITSGNLARLEISLGEPGAAEQTLRDALQVIGDGQPALTRMRLQTLLVEACLDRDDGDAARAEGLALRALMEATAAREHYLQGFAALALARVQQLDGDLDSVREYLDLAERRFSFPSLLAWVKYWEAVLIPGVADADGWQGGMQQLFDQDRGGSDAELYTSLLLAERAARRGDVEAMRERLDAGLQLSTMANNRLWLERVDRTYRELDPVHFAGRVAERFSGRTADELARTVSEEATIIFADLVSFTARSVELLPEEVMQTVRSVFELSVPLMAEHQVRPISYLGDGLLAVAQGGDHRLRGLHFAEALVRRAYRVTAVRHSLGEKWGLELRAGVASGPLVMGVLGSHYKLEYLCIGRTTNLAARLQGQAEPGEVMAAWDTAQADAARGTEEALTLKGLPGKVRALRFHAAG